MIITNELLLDEFRAKVECAWCGRRTLQGCHPHHIFSRGAGRLDVRINIVNLCWRCHFDHHNGLRPLRCDLLAVVAARENVLQPDIKAVVYLLRRLPKQPTVERIVLELHSLNGSEKRLVRKTLNAIQENQATPPASAEPSRRLT